MCVVCLMPRAWKQGMLDKFIRKQKGHGCRVAGCPRITGKLNEKLQQYGKAALTHMVDRPEFWKVPGKVATLTEQGSAHGAQACLRELELHGARCARNETSCLKPTTR